MPPIRSTRTTVTRARTRRAAQASAISDWDYSKLLVIFARHLEISTDSIRKWIFPKFDRELPEWSQVDTEMMKLTNNLWKRTFTSNFFVQLVYDIAENWESLRSDQERLVCVEDHISRPVFLEHFTEKVYRRILSPFASVVDVDALLGDMKWMSFYEELLFEAATSILWTAGDGSPRADGYEGFKKDYLYIDVLRVVRQFDNLPDVDGVPTKQMLWRREGTPY